VRLALKIDVDTYRGISDGAAPLAAFLHSRKIPASFFVSLGPDNSGWAATRAFRHKGFLKKMNRTSALSLYGLRTVLSGTLLPARPMGASFPDTFREWKEWGFEVSPHGYDHILWHDQAAGWDASRAARELEKLAAVYRHTFGEDPKSFAAPGWQASWGTWQAMEKINLLYHSDTRGEFPYFPSPYKTLEIPTTLPTWDEMLAWDSTPPQRGAGALKEVKEAPVTRHTLVDETWKLLKKDALNVWTIHAEFEGMVYFPQFHEFIERAEREGVEWVFLPKAAREYLDHPERVPCATIEQGSVPGRAGTVTCQHG
jgi:undecaprenyl phosphate-alpha-L-ara4FN deformylase